MQYSIETMSVRHENAFYMIHCKRTDASCYYTTGIGCLNIPFQHATQIELQKITMYNTKKVVHNFFPVFIKFQSRVREHVRWIKKQRSIRVFLQRELIGVRAQST